MSIAFGEPAPWFQASTPSHPEFIFDSAAGRFVLLVFLPLDEAARGVALQALSAQRPLFDDRRISAFAVVRDPQTAGSVRDIKGLRWILDLKGDVSGAFGLTGQDSPWLLFDPTLRLLDKAEADLPDAFLERLKALPAPAEHGGAVAPAPILIVPRVFEPEFCQQLIDLLDGEGGGAFSGVMRDRGERTVAVMDDLKKRRDVLITDPDLQAQVRRRLETRLFPMVERAFGFKVTRMERYLVSCYAAEDGGVFHPHRDNTTQVTAHRKFAGSINLNDDYEGGDLRFPEFGPTTYRPPIGGSCVFGCGLLHEATRVTAGRRYAFLPFFYDEAGQAMLDDYKRRVSAAEPVES